MLSTLLLSIAMLQPPSPAPEPFPQACQAYGPALEATLAKMASPSETISAANRSTAAVRLPHDRGVVVRLHRQAEVRFEPLTVRRGGPDSFAGIVSLGSLPTGRWQVAADDRVWLDIASSGRTLETPSFDMHADCPVVRKTVMFEQTTEGDALLLISGGSRAEVRLMIARVP
jgi:hypothetical protein